ncbi:peptidoglycan-binding domain-containing protein [Ilumatobacter sp.]|uniref:peptidoglycan-binding domain-containing protein n=1 Tax=Ilumatobacter sp. TaxID=1967498 RepID=UPI003B521A5F
MTTPTPTPLRTAAARRAARTGAVVATAIATLAACSSGSDDAVRVPTVGDDATTATAGGGTVGASTGATGSGGTGDPGSGPTTTDPVPPRGTGAETGEGGGATTTAPPTSTTTTTTSTTVVEFVRMREGDQGSRVAVVQLKLGVLGYLPVGTDSGVFDAATDAAVRRFQTDYALFVDGVVGPQTDRALTAAANSVNVDSGG